MSSKNKFSVLIPDGESTHLILIVNCLSLQKDVDVYVMSSKKTCHMRYSRFVKKYIYYPKSSTTEWINNIDKVVIENNVDVILPIFEIAIGKLSEHKDILKTKDKLCHLPDIKNFNLAGNKGLLCSHLEAYKFSYPESFIVNYGTVPDFNHWQYPLIAKPVRGFGGGENIEVLNNSKDAMHYFDSKTYEYDTIVQEYIDGFDICSNVLCKDGKILAYSCQKGIAFEHGPNSTQIAFEFVDDKEVFELTKRLMQSLNWSGPANIDWRFDYVKKEYKLIEINTRFWRNISESALAGVNFPYLHCLSSLGIAFNKTDAKLNAFMNLKGLARKIAKKPYYALKLKYLFNNTSLRFLVMDPLPFMHKYFSRTYYLLFKR